MQLGLGIVKLDWELGIVKLHPQAPSVPEGGVSQLLIEVHFVSTLVLHSDHTFSASQSSIAIVYGTILL